jgi:hypothetical protein
MATAEEEERINRLLDMEDIDLTDWEADFVNSLADQVADGSELSEKQADKLEDIYLREFPDG